MQTRRTLFQEANINAEQSAAVEHLFHLGVTLQTVCFSPSFFKYTIYFY